MPHYVICDRDGRVPRTTAIHADRKCPHIARKPDFTKAPGYAVFRMVKRIRDTTAKWMLGDANKRRILRGRWYRCLTCMGYEAG